MPISYEAFAVAAPGLTDLVANELVALHLTPAERSPAGVLFSCDAEGLSRANLQLRVASRVIVRLADFEAAHFSTLEKKLRAIPWAEWIAAGAPVSVRATCRKSRLYHSGAVAERVEGAIASQVAHDARVVVDEDADDGASQLVVVRIDHDRCTVSIDSSGALLHRRGYRQAVAKAPLRETLAAAMLQASGWDGTRPLIDPMCGSGTIPIEAALLARRIAPGRSRAFAFQRWPRFDRRGWDRVHAAALEGELAASPERIMGSDRDAGAIGAALANADRAGVAGDINFTQQPLSAVRAQGDAAGLVLVNPPYGERIGEPDALRNLYAQVGNLVRGPLAGWDLGMLTADDRLTRQVGVALSPMLQLSNGGLRVVFSVARAVAGDR